MHERNQSVFDRSGLASREDLRTPEWAELFRFLEAEQEAFLRQEPSFRGPGYRWPSDALHDFSRMWEYPYMYHHLRRWQSAGLAGEGLPRVVDVGSGVTFFPFSAARLGFHVLCTDLDSACERDLKRAAECVGAGPGRVEFRLTDGKTLPFADGEANVVYCISVLEHIPDFGHTVKEIARILKPGGLFLLTVDVDLCETVPLGASAHRTLVAELQKHFRYQCPDVTIHPADLILSDAGEYSRERRGLQSLARGVLRPLLRLLGRGRSIRVAVQGFVLTRLGAGRKGSS